LDVVGYVVQVIFLVAAISAGGNFVKVLEYIKRMVLTYLYFKN
jgi:hypothetical protein